MIARVFSCSLSLVLVFWVAPGFAQSSGSAGASSGTTAVAAVSAPAIPKDPIKLMLLGAKVNGLGPNMKPWHLKVNFQTFDADGKSKDQGVWEEWRESSEKWKSSYTSKEFNQVMYRNGDLTSRMMTGDSGWIPVQDSMATSTLYEPFPDGKRIKKSWLQSADRKFGAVPLHCVSPFTVAPELKATEETHGNLMLGLRGLEGFPTVCFNPGSAVARVLIYPDGISMVFDDVVLVDGQYVARDIWLRNGKFPIAHLSVSMLDVPAKINDSEFVPPASAKPVPLQRYNEKLVMARWKSGRRLDYSALARENSIHGEVILNGTLTSNGDFTDIEIISGPKELRKASLDAAKTWKYKPCLLNGKPVNVRTPMILIFR